MKKLLIVLIALLSLAFLGKSYAEMKITPEGVTFPNASTQIMAAAPPWSQKLPASERFELVLPVIVLIHGKKTTVYRAVLDKETGLVWERTGSSEAMSWHKAFEYCWDSTTGGRKGWRLPTMEELLSLVDPSESAPALPDGHPFLGDHLSNIYWSSTTQSNQTISAWGVQFSTGNRIHTLKTAHEYNYVRAVRGGYGHDGW